MTYGWMLLVVAVVGGAIFSIVQQESVESVSGFTGGDVTVDDFGTTNAGNLQLVLRNTGSESVDLNSVNVSLGDSYSALSDSLSIPVGGTESVTLANVTEGDSANSLDTTVNYDVGGLSNLEVSGTVSGSFEISDSGSSVGDDGSGDNGGGPTVVSASNAPSFDGDEWIPVAPNSSVQQGFDHFFDETSDEEYFNVSEGFYVMKYEAKAYDTSSSSFVNDGGSSDNWATTDVEPRSVADNEPWRYIAFNNNEYDAVEACQTLDSQTNDFDVHLITNREWMTIARQIEQNNANWVDTSDGSDADVGDSGAGIYRGSVGLGTELDVDLSGPQPANVAEEERTLELANGKIIWDLSGNANQWVDVEEDGTYLSKRLVSQGDWDEVEGGMTDPWSMNKGDQSGKQLKYESGPSSISWANRDNGVGFAFEIQDLEYKAARRGGAWTRGDSAGIFLLSALDDSRIPSEYIGFRCSAVPVS